MSARDLVRERLARWGQRGTGADVLDMRLLVPAVAAWTLVAAALGLDPVWLVGLGACCLLVAVLLLLRHRTSAALALLAPGALLLALCGHLLLRSVGPLEGLVVDRATVVAEVRVTGEPHRLANALGGPGEVLLRAECRRVVGRGAVGPCRAELLLRGGSDLSSLRWRSVVTVRGRLAPLSRGDRPLAVLEVRGEVVQSEEPGPVERAAETVRRGLREASAGLSPDPRGLLPGLVLGDTSLVPEDLVAAMRSSGLTHLTAVSGANVAIILALVLWSCRLLGLPRPWRPPAAAVALCAFVVLARPEPSVLRASAMGLVGLVGLGAGRRTRGPAALAAAILGLLALDPWLARDAGFALSTLATTGLLLFARPWGEAWARRWPAWLRPLGPVLAVPVAAQVCCAPVIVLLQGQVTLVGVLTNLLAAPLVPPATVLGVTGAALSLVAHGPARWCATAAGLPAGGIASVARWGAQVPGANLPWPGTSAGAVALAAVLVLGVLGAPWLTRRVRAHPALTALSVALLVGGSAPTRSFAWPEPGWRVAFCDVGQGDAAVLRTGESSAVVVDVGPRPELVDRCLRRLGVSSLDAVVLTHFHADHVDGLPGALGGRRVGGILTTATADPPFQADEVARWAREGGIPVRVLRNGDRLEVGWLRAQVWGPDRPVAGGSVPNNASLVLAAHVGAVDVLLLGDVEREAGHDLLRRIRAAPDWLAMSHRFDVVKSPHHGSANLDADLLAEVRAPVAVISVGEGNDYGHPAPSHLAALRRNGYAVLRTDERGDILVSDQAGVVAVRTER